jgi:hypothetical protein
MNPNAFLRTFWRTEVRPEVFVAMDFSDAFQRRFEAIIEPAVNSLSYIGTPLSAKRVDLSRTGDSILTDINDGVAHSVLFLADVSTVGHDSKTSKPFRNGNVMYEVGLALASRQPAEILLIRDDKEPFLFDVSTVPHKHIDFANADEAVRVLTAALADRLHEINHVEDARLRRAASSLTYSERTTLATGLLCDGSALSRGHYRTPARQGTYSNSGCIRRAGGVQVDEPRPDIGQKSRKAIASHS